MAANSPIESPPLKPFLNPLSGRARALLAIAIFLIALGLRIVGIGWGMPNEMRNQSLHPDETLNMLVADEMAAPWHVGFYNYGTLYFTATKIVMQMGKAYGWVPTGETTAEWQYLGGLTMSGRVISATCGAATIAVVFLLLASLTNLLGAITGCFALLIAPGHVVHSRFATSDITAVLLIAIAAFMIWRILHVPEEQRVKNAALFGLVAGMAAGTKYTGALLILSGLWALWSVDRGQFVRGSCAIGIGAIVGFLLATPGVIAQFSLFRRDFLYEIAHTAEGHGIVFANTPSGFAYHLVNLVAAFGMVALVLAVIGLGVAVFKREKWAIPFVIFCVAYFIVIGRAEVKFLRYVFPLLPFLAVGFGYLVGQIHAKGKYWRILNMVAILAVGFSMRTENGAIRLSAFMATEDPRDIAARWIKSNAQEQTIGFVMDPWFWSPPLFANTGLLGADNRLRAMHEENHSLIRYIPSEGPRKEWDPRIVTVAQPEWITFSSFEFYDHDRINQPDFVECIDRLTETYDLAAVVWGGSVYEADNETRPSQVDRAIVRNIILRGYPLLHDMMYIQPTVCIFRKRPTN